MATYNHEEVLWQHALLEMESTINVAQQLIPLDQSDEIHIARLSLENVALHNRSMPGHRHSVHSIHSYSSFEWGQPAGRSRSHETISSEPANQLQAIRLGPLIGPPCTQCMVFPAVRPRQIPRILCYRCLQSTLNVMQSIWWTAIFPRHIVLCDPIIVPRIVEYTTGTGLDRYCHCGHCNPDWFLHGWECWPVHN